MIETMLNTHVGEGREGVDVSPETWGVMKLLEGTLVTPQVLGLYLVSPQQLLVATIHMLFAIPSLRKQAWSLVKSVGEEDVRRHVDWKTVMSKQTHKEVPTEFQRYTTKLLDVDGLTQLEHFILHDEHGDSAALALLDKDIGKRACRRINRSGRTPLMMAAERNLHRVCEAILANCEPGREGCNLQAVNSRGNTALQIACNKNMKSTVLKMLEFGPDRCNLGHVNEDGFTALQIACNNKCEETALKMLYWGAPACNLGHMHTPGPDAPGVTALEMAYYKCLPTVCLRMLAFGAEACHLQHIPCACGPDEVDLLLGRGTPLPFKSYTPPPAMQGVYNRMRTMAAALDGNDDGRERVWWWQQEQVDRDPGYRPVDPGYGPVDPGYGPIEPDNLQ